MSDIRFNTWLHQSGTGGITQVDGGHVGIGTTNPDIAVHTANAKKVNVGIVTANSVYAGNYYGNGSNLTGLNSDKIEEGDTKVEVVDSGSQYIVGEVNGSERIRVDSTGKITHTATTNNTATLDLYGGNTTVSAVGEVNAQLRFRSKDNSVTNSEENVGGAIKSITEFSNGAYVGLSFETYKQDRTPRLQEALRITNAGRLGINHPTPSTMLHVRGSDNVLATFESTDADSLIEFKDNSTSDIILMGAVGGDDLLLRCDAGSVKFHVANNNEKFRIGPAGQIGLNGANYGTSGQVLTSQGSGAVVQWAAAPTPYGGALDGMIFGGTETTYTSGGTTYKVHTFTSTGFLRVTAAISMNFLIVGGGGGTAAAELSYGATGGGGAGGMVEGTGITIPAGKHTITVGSGGAASNAYNVAGSGGDSSFAYGGTTVTAKGGGGSPDYASAGTNGGSGSGGSEPNGAAGSSTQSSQNSGISNIQQFGNAGGAAAGYTSGAGGGGGAGGAGQARSAGGAGGSGRANSITGSSVTYAVGGNGGATGYANGSAGTNGRGNGASGATSSHPSEGQGAAGGSGIVIVRYVFS